MSWQLKFWKRFEKGCNDVQCDLIIMLQMQQSCWIGARTQLQSSRTSIAGGSIRGLFEVWKELQPQSHQETSQGGNGKETARTRHIYHAFMMLSESPKSWFGSSDPIWLRCGNMTSLCSLRCVKDGIEVCGKMHWDATVPFMRTQGVGRGRRWRRCWKKGYLQDLCVLSMIWKILPFRPGRYAADHRSATLRDRSDLDRWHLGHSWRLGYLIGVNCEPSTLWTTHHCLRFSNLSTLAGWCQVVYRFSSTR